MMKHFEALKRMLEVLEEPNDYLLQLVAILMFKAVRSYELDGVFGIDSWEIFGEFKDNKYAILYAKWQKDKEVWKFSYDERFKRGRIQHRNEDGKKDLDIVLLDWIPGNKPGKEEDNI